MSDWSLVEQIVDEALLLSVEDQNAFIKDRCKGDSQLENDVRDFLKSIQQSSDLFDSAANTKQFAYKNALNEKSRNSAKLIGTEIDKYKIVDLISHGGMGTVFLAERNDGLYNQTVALKLIRHGMETPENICRFEKEREILAGLNHPNIAKLIDGGVTDFGLPYLVMEFIDGKPIDTYCDDNKLTVKQRIKLFTGVCKAVQYAHNNLVIHRDLKPDNIFIDANGHIKILDFGVAKLIENQFETKENRTDLSREAVTPAYAAPEQISGETVTTSTDTYSLGILLYKLLSGITPFDFSNYSKLTTRSRQNIVQMLPPKPSDRFNQISVHDQQIISENRSTTISKLFNSLRGDLDAIILKALEKKSTDRYQTIDNLVDDLTKYLVKLPVSVYQNNFMYRAKKFIHRNYKLASATAALVLLSLTFGFYHTNRVTEERNIAQDEALKTAEVSSLLFDLFEANDPDQSLGETVTAQELLEKGLSRAEKLVEQPDLQSQMFRVIGKVYLKMGNLPKAEELINNSVQIYNRLYGIDHPETALAIADQASVNSAFGNYSRAESLYEYSLNILSNHSGSYMNQYTNAISEHAYVLRRQGKYSEAEDAFRKNYDLLKSQHGELHPKTLAALNGVGVTRFNRGKYEEAEKIIREVLDKRIEVFGETHPDIAESKNSLGALLMNIGVFDQAEKLFEDAFFLRNRILGSDHPKTLLTLNNLALMQRDQGKFDLSMSTFERVLRLKEARFGTESIASAITYFSFGELYLMTDEFETANSYFQKALPVFEKLLGKEHSFSARTKMNLGFSYLLSKDLQKANKLIVEGYEQVIQIHPEISLERAIANHQYGMLKLNQGQFEIASDHLNKSLSALKSIERSESARRKIVLNDIQRLNQLASAN
ncbi:serine/threonine-protein kinase [Rhodohalobacter barkolensis]|uniref:Protein kinase domain-containing protein n=1 Tax=Rhodohalobacter barkolensis TaxID=2053187 RepID=A0A2N0VKN5_9BACT|nr:serine/threonine-protein kinase [Rhodohalobacter barkolensis]PKD44740.1 hypothetical protein CWD77_04550 [Rhodohalobacter barkolensis]